MPATVDFSLAVVDRPWEQQRGEPNDYYGYFVLYRNIGPGRTLQHAYNSFRKTFRNADQSAIEGKNQQLPIPGSWGSAAAHWKWSDRAEAWDCHVFDQFGKRACIKFVGALDKIADKLCEALARPEMEPRTWADLVSALDILQRYAQPETVADIRKRTANLAVQPGPDQPAGVPLSCLNPAEKHDPVPIGELVYGDGPTDDDGIT